MRILILTLLMASVWAVELPKSLRGIWYEVTSFKASQPPTTVVGFGLTNHISIKGSHYAIDTIAPERAGYLMTSGSRWIQALHISGDYWQVSIIHNREATIYTIMIHNPGEEKT